MANKEALYTQALYDPGDPALLAEQAALAEILYDFNATRPSEQGRREELLKRLLAQVGENVYIEPPLRCSWGVHTHIGNGVYANFNLTLVDDAPIHIGDHVMIGPNVTIATAGHPIHPLLRKRGLQFNAAVSVGNGAWLGAGAILLPGVNVGENAVIGAGSVVTRDIPANVVAAGNPCRVLRPIGKRDEEYYFREHRINWEEY